MKLTYHMFYGMTFRLGMPCDGAENELHLFLAWLSKRILMVIFNWSTSASSMYLHTSLGPRPSFIVDFWRAWFVMPHGDRTGRGQALVNPSTCTSSRTLFWASHSVREGAHTPLAPSAMFLDETLSPPTKAYCTILYENTVGTMGAAHFECLTGDMIPRSLRCCNSA
jgi:hypothetical protein